MTSASPDTGARWYLQYCCSCGPVIGPFKNVQQADLFIRHKCGGDTNFSSPFNHEHHLYLNSLFYEDKFLRPYEFDHEFWNTMRLQNRIHVEDQ